MNYRLKLKVYENDINTQELEEEGVDVSDREAVLEYGRKRASEWLEELDGQDVHVGIIEETPPVETLTIEIAKEFLEDEESHYYFRGGVYPH